MSDMLHLLETLVEERRAKPKAGSYTNQLLDAGIQRLAQKVGEEGVEVVVAALAQGRTEQIGELADLFFHVIVLMSELGIKLEDVSNELERRHAVREAR